MTAKTQKELTKALFIVRMYARRKKTVMPKKHIKKVYDECVLLVLGQEVYQSVTADALDMYILWYWGVLPYTPKAFV